MFRRLSKECFAKRFLYKRKNDIPLLLFNKVK